MANISAELAAIMAAVFGRDVRQSIHDAIYKVNETSEVCISAGTAVTAPNSSSTGYFEKSLYINTNTWKLWRCMGVDTWQSLGILRGDDGRGIVAITGPTTVGLVDTYTIEYTDGTDSTFSITNGADGADGSDGVDGVDGSKWYKGTALTGTGTGITGFPGYKDDFYLNSTDGYVYQCTATGGAANPGAATWDYVMTLSGGGGGSVTVVDNLNSTSATDALSANQGRNLDRKKIEKPAGATAGQVLGYDGTDWVPINYTGGGLLPYFYIDSEAGATVTVTAPDGSTITPTAAGTGHWECEVPFYGVYTIHSVLSGQGDATVTVTVDDVKEYHITDNHFDFTINVTAPVGSTVRITGGGETYTGTGTGSPDVYAVHQANTVYTVTATQILDGNTKTDSETVISASTSGQSTSVTLEIEFGTINVNVGAPFVAAGSQITCIKSTEICTPKTAASTLQFRVPSEGVWTISGTVDGILYQQTANVTSLSVPVLVTLETRPDGKTATPTDVIQTWLECAGIRNKSYTTLEEVLADKETLQTLISDENAVDYMVRSKTWIGGKESLVPQMTSETLPEGLTFSSGNYNANHPSWKAFVEGYTGSTGQAWMANGITNAFIGYKFTSPKIIDIIEFQNAGIDSASAIRIKDYIIQASNDTTDGTDGTWVDLYSGTYANNQHVESVNINNNNAYIAYRIYFTTAYSYYIAAYDIKFKRFGLTDDPTAMRYIGLRNYASDTLLDDADWCEAICNSACFESVLNAKVPIMTSNTQPSGEAIGNNLRSSAGNTVLYWLYDDNDTTSPDPIYDYTGIPNSYYGYGFETPKIIKKVSFIIQPTAALKKVKIYGSQTKETDLSNTTLIDEISIALPANTKSTASVLLNNDNAYKYYYFQVNISSSGNYASTYMLQFYGREDVDESVIHIYSAASDNDIHYLSGSAPVTVASTDPDGHGTIARTLLPAGTYDLYSSVAMDPDGDMSTQYYHKEVTVKADTIEIMLRPADGVDIAYWYGYKNNVGSMAVVAPALNYTAAVNIDANTHYVAISGAGGIITPKPVTGKIAKAIVSDWSGGPGEYVEVWTGLTVYPDPGMKSVTDKIAGIHLMVNDTSEYTMNRYISFHTTSGSSGSSSAKVYALWAEGSS